MSCRKIKRGDEPIHCPANYPDKKKWAKPLFSVSPKRHYNSLKCSCEITSGRDLLRWKEHFINPEMFSFEEDTENQIWFFRQTGLPVTLEWRASSLEWEGACYETGYFLFNYRVWEILFICMDNEGHRRRIFTLVTEAALESSCPIWEQSEVLALVHLLMG